MPYCWFFMFFLSRYVMVCCGNSDLISRSCQMTQMTLLSRFCFSVANLCKETLCSSVGSVLGPALTLSLSRLGAEWVQLQPGQNQISIGQHRSASVPVAPSSRSASGPSRRASPTSPGGCRRGSLGVSGPK